MKQMELLMRLQRLLDEETAGSGPEDEADLIEELEEMGDLDDIGAGAGEMQEVFSMLKDKDDLGGELEELLGGGDLEGVEAELGLSGIGAAAAAPAAAERPGKGRDRGAERPLERLLKGIAERRRGRAAPAGGRERPIGRLLDLLQTLGEMRDRQSETTELRRLKKFMTSRQGPGGLTAPEPRDPVVARRRKQVQEFFAAWREALDSAPPAAARSERAAEAAPESGSTGETHHRKP